MIGRNKFASGIADSADTALVLASDWNAEILLGFILTNRTGGVLNEGDVVAIDSANDKSVVLADTAGARRQYAVFVSAVPSSLVHTPGTSINNLDTGIFLPVGLANKLKVAGATTRGNYLRKSATAQALEDTGVAVGSAPPGDAIATALTGTGGAGTVAGIFRGLPISPGGNLKSMQKFEASGTWTRPAGIRRVVIEVQGAGGGSSGAPGTGAGQTSGGEGGGGGGYALKLLDVASIATSTITVGAAGAAGGVGGAGGAGGVSSWADGTNTVTGNGGAGGGPQGPAAGEGSGAGSGVAGGTATGGDINLSGGRGGPPIFGQSIDVGRGGDGGGSRFSPGTSGTGNGVGSAAPAFGGGASGSGNLANTAGKVGAVGGAGVVIVWEFE